EWKAYGVAVGTYALARNTGEPIELPGTPTVTVCDRRWSKAQISTPAAVAAMASGNLVVITAALGTPHSVIATSDGFPANTSRWCEKVAACGDAPETFYSRFTPTGIDSHGWVCGHCRALRQTG
ncbi:MAG: hypothetical protein H7Y15_19740, partial [Pseudonocardia sp.]|nr:hypothetical protein [Pseudonocardia sp.]